MSNLNLTDYAVSQTIDLVSFSFLLFGVWVLGSLVAFHYNKFFEIVPSESKIVQAFISPTALRKT